MNKDEKYYGRGTILKVSYEIDGDILVEEKCILAECYDTKEVFQVIAIDGRYSGVIEGYISKQFSDNRKGFCNINHLEQQLRERIFHNFKSFEIVETVVYYQTDFDSLNKTLKEGGLKSPFK
ncbi:hypothetical protein [Moheibacter sp.]|uniref:hypothetical protein n=1 Tax=Moheibacter sp. TaxID=1965316 RepID=UPI003C70A060